MYLYFNLREPYTVDACESWEDNLSHRSVDLETLNILIPFNPHCP